MVKIFTSSDGSKIQVGENAKENDAIRKTASQKDFWFHLENTSSPHVILSVQKSPSKQEIYECSQLVKHFSKLKNIKEAYVIYIEVKKVKKGENDGEVELKSKPERILIQTDSSCLEKFKL
jgi:predicted ribosome quality control (RQC) complex YloA/Tae2 family protein